MCVHRWKFTFHVRPWIAGVDINDEWICDMAEPKTLETLVSDVVRKVTRFFDDLCENEEHINEFDPWKREMTQMMEETKTPNYICEDNLVILMNWRIAVSEHWEGVRDALRVSQREHYNTLQVKMDSIIARIQLKILLGKLAEVGR